MFVWEGMMSDCLESGSILVLTTMLDLKKRVVSNI